MSDAAVRPATDRGQVLGEVFARFGMTVEAGKVREFARATGAAPEDYLAPTAVVPPTFLVSSAFWQPVEMPRLTTLLGWDLKRTLHGESEFRFLRPVRVGTRLSVSARVESIREKTGKRGGRMTMATLVTEFVDDDGALLAQMINTAIQTGSTL